MEAVIFAEERQYRKNGHWVKQTIFNNGHEALIILQIRLQLLIGWIMLQNQSNELSKSESLDLKIWTIRSRYNSETRKRRNEKPHLDAVLKYVSRNWESFLPINRLTKNDDLLEQEDSPLLRPGQEATVLFCDSKSVLLKQLSLCCDFPL